MARVRRQPGDRDLVITMSVSPSQSSASMDPGTHLLVTQVAGIVGGVKTGVVC